MVHGLLHLVYKPASRSSTQATRRLLSHQYSRLPAASVRAGLSFLSSAKPPEWRHAEIRWSWVASVAEGQLQRKTHYVYETYSQHCGRKYIGVRSCNGDPASDPYMGSHSDKSYIPTHKKILNVFDSRDEAEVEEIRLHDEHDVGRSPLFANRAKSTSTFFSRAGVAVSQEVRARISAACIGRKFSPETRAKISAACTGRTLSPESRAKIAAANTGKTLSTETRAKISASLSGTMHSPEARAKMSAAKQGERHPMHGKTHSTEARAKMSAAKQGNRNPMYGKTHSPEARAKMSAAKQGERNPMHGRTHSPEARAKISAAATGRTPSPEARAKMSAAKQGDRHPMHGRTHSPEVRAKISAAKTSRRSQWCNQKSGIEWKVERSPRNSGERITFSTESRVKVSVA